MQRLWKESFCSKSQTTKMKLLIIRFSSFGDMVQALFAVELVRSQFPQAEIHWVTRLDQAEWLKESGLVDRVWALDRRQGFRGLWKLSNELKDQSFTHIYDAHSNTRSHWLSFYLKSLTWPWRRPQFVRRSKERFKRWLLFVWRVNRYSHWPYRGAWSYMEPLKVWGLELPDQAQETAVNPQPFSGLESLDSEAQGWIGGSVVLVPSANWELKRWPLERWQELVRDWPEQRFTVLAGPEDGFVEQIVAVAPDRVRSFAGRFSWVQSISALGQAKAVVSGDTGLLHMADFLGRPTVALLGPTAFGFPFRSTTKLQYLNLPCSPCTKDGRGRCKNKVHKQCLWGIQAKGLKQEILRSLER